MSPTREYSIVRIALWLYKRTNMAFRKLKKNTLSGEISVTTHL